MAREAGQSFLPAGAHRQLSHRLSRLTLKWAAHTRSCTTCTLSCTMQIMQREP